MFVIAGATGNTGSVVADALLSAGKKVRVLVRDAKKGEPWKAKGADVRLLDSLQDEAALASALEGAEGAYLLVPPSMAAPDIVANNKKTVDAIAGAIERSKVRHVVFLSSVGGQHEAGTGPIKTLHYGEERLAKTPAKLTFIRAAYFLENWAAVAGATKGGKLPSFLPADLAIPMVATRDIGAVAAKALLDGPPASKIDVVELAGSRDLSPRDVAASFAKILGQDVNVDVAPLDAVVPVYTGFGMSKSAAENFREMYEGILNGKVAFEKGSATTRLVRGTVDPEQLFRAFVA